METPLKVDISFRFNYPVNYEPTLIFPPGEIIRAAHDFECDDPRAYTDKAYVPRVYGTKYTIPEAFKLNYPDHISMTLDWATLWHDLMEMYAPRAWSGLPANLNDGNDWEWLNGFKPASELDKWYLHEIHGARAFTNKVGPNNPGNYDPYTGFGTPGEGGGMQPYRKEGVTTGGNYFWSAGRFNNDWRVWCLDGGTPQSPMPAPKAEQIKDMFFLVHIATQCTPRCIDPTPRPEINCPNGIWEITEFPQCGDNIVPVPLISCWKDAPTMQWNGLNLRQNVLTNVRMQTWPPPEVITYPYIPYKKMRPNP